MGKKSGKACTAVEPVAPDDGRPGHVTLDGSEPVKPFKPTEEDEENEEKSWIEIEMVDEEDNPVPGMKYKVTLSDETVAEGTLDGKGFARLEGIPKGNCKVTFPELDKEAWEKK
jgi:hypothetical protein